MANCYSTLLSADDLAQAEITIVTFIQSAAFPKEITCLSNIKSEGLADYWKFQKSKKLSIKRISSIHCLDSYLKNGILRVGSRLNRAELLPETAHPTILPYKNHVTALIIRHLHRQLGHVGHNHVIAAIREKYWVIKVNAAVRWALPKCVFCLRHHGKATNRRRLIYLKTVLRQYLHLPTQGLTTLVLSS